MAKTLRTLTTTLALAAITAAPIVEAVGFGDMFNPGRWFGGGNNRGDYYDDY